MNTILKSFLVLVFALGVAAGPDHDGHHMHGNSDAWQIKAYTSAAPAVIGDHATVISADGRVLREGTNGWTCRNLVPMPDGGFADAHATAAACSDPNAVAWVEAYIADKTPQLKGDGWIWMKHGDLGVDNFKPYTDCQKDAGHKHYIESGAHMMLMPKDPTSLDGQTTDYTSGAPYVMFKGTKFVHLMIPLDGYYDYQPEAAPK